MAANPQNVQAQTMAILKLKKSQLTAGGIEESGMAGSCLFSKREAEASGRREGRQDINRNTIYRVGRKTARNGREVQAHPYSLPA